LNREQPITRHAKVTKPITHGQIVKLFSRGNEPGGNVLKLEPMSNHLRIINADALEALRALPTESVHCVCTSPPYWGLRDYGTASWEGGDNNCDHLRPTSPRRDSKHGVWQETRATQDATKANSFAPFPTDCGKCGAKRIDSQLGLEKTPEEYVAKMVEVFREVRRVLRKDGTLWLNLGDSYSNGGADQSFRNATNENWSGGSDAKKPRCLIQRRDSLKPKDLCGIPWRVAFALQADGWYLRQDIIWAKPNPMPESVTDRCTKAHEYLFLLTKESRYYFDTEAIKERSDQIQGPRPFGGACNGKQNLDRADYFYQGDSGNRNKRSVWTVATAPYPEAHFATYPPDLIKPCIMAGTSAKGCCAKCGAPWGRVTENQSSIPKRQGEWKATGENHRNDIERKGGFYDSSSETIGWQPTCQCVEVGSWTIEPTPITNCPTVPCTVLDPFAGSGTTGAVALELGRRAILIELNPKYVELISQRCNVTPGLALA
jgi:DNA modification methylase